MTMKRYSKALEWSMISNTPVLCLFKDTGDYAVVWKGIIMGYEQALMITGEKYLNVFPTPLMKEYAFESFCKLCKTGLLGDVNWHYTLSAANHYKRLKNLTHTNQNNQEVIDYPVIAEWFDKKNALEI